MYANSDGPWNQEAANILRECDEYHTNLLRNLEEHEVAWQVRDLILNDTTNMRRLYVRSGEKMDATMKDRDERENRWRRRCTVLCVVTGLMLTVLVVIACYACYACFAPDARHNDDTPTCECECEKTVASVVEDSAPLFPFLRLTLQEVWDAL